MSFVVSALPVAAKGDAARGKSLAYTCSGCHGTNRPREKETLTWRPVYGPPQHNLSARDTVEALSPPEAP